MRPSGVRYILLKDQAKLTEDYKGKRLEKLAETHAKLYKLYHHRIKLHNFFNQNLMESPRAAKKLLNKWIFRQKDYN